METLQENEYVTREIHDLQLERIELLLERNIARQEAMYEGLRAEVRTLDAKVDGLEKKMDEKINGLEKKVDARVDGIMDAITLTNMRIDDLKNAQANNLAKWGIIFAVGICVVQIATSLILHFWK